MAILRLHLHPDVMSEIKLVKNSESGESLAEINIDRWQWKNLPASLHPPLEAFGQDGIIEEDVVAALDSELSMIYFYNILEKCRAQNLLLQSIESNGQKLATFSSLDGCGHRYFKKFAPHEKVELSRFVNISFHQGKCYLVSSVSSGELIIYHEAFMHILHRLATSTHVSELYNQTPLSKNNIDLFLSILYSMQAIGHRESEALLQWEAHDLAFHVRSRAGRHRHTAGGTYRFKDKIDPLPLVKPAMSENTIPLYKPNIDNLKTNDPSFTQVLESRQSIRQYNGLISSQELGEFLYRSVRIKKKLLTPLQDVSKRPYPSGGAIHEQELYLLIQNCDGISPGIYHYSPEKHVLEVLGELNAEAKQLLLNAKYATGIDSSLQVLFLIGARFARLSWKYQSIAYAVMLKNAGALIQTLYLAATAMGLAPCAVGAGDSELFSQAIGTDYFEETSIAEFLLGK